MYILFILPNLLKRSHTTDSIWLKSGLWYSAGAYYPTTESKISVKALEDALNGKKVPTTINVLHQPNTPLIIDQAFLKAHPNFKGDWSL